MKTRLNDFVIKINANEPNSFQSHLNNFLHQKPCSCGKVCSTEPLIKQSAKFLFVEVDRSKTGEEAEQEECELSLYSLKLERTYDVLGKEYEVFATINLNLEQSDGGHYNTLLLLDQDQAVRLHEEMVERTALPPAFDHDAVIVALRLIESPELLEDCKEPEAAGVAEEAALDLVPLPEHENPAVSREQNCAGQAPVSVAETAAGGGERRQVSTKESFLLPGDSLRLYLNRSDDKEIVNKYREEHERKLVELVEREKGRVEDVSLKSLGGQMLTSKVYRIQSLHGSKKRRKKFSKLDSSMIDNDVKGKNDKNGLILRLNIPEEVGILK